MCVFIYLCLLKMVRLITLHLYYYCMPFAACTCFFCKIVPYINSLTYLLE